jgi:Glycosyltransferase like family
VIVFGTAVTDSDTYERYAVPGIQRAAESDSIVYAHQSAGSVFRNYNLLLDKAAAHDDLEALVLIHQDCELVETDFAARIREVLSDPDVAVVGCAGSVGVRSIAWWQGALRWAALTHRYPEFGGGDFPAISWSDEALPAYASPGEVDSIDGFVIVLSPWAVRNLRFDESLGKLHGYDFDICMQAKAAGKKIFAADFRAIHHHSLELIRDPETWIQTYVRLAEKWDDQLPEPGSDIRQRALRAEAEAACARAIMVSHQMRESAVKRQLARTEEELDGTRDQLKAARRELAEVRRKHREAVGDADSPGAAQSPALSPGKLAAIDYAVDDLGIESFASLEIGQAYGQYAFYAIDKPGVQRGALLNVGPRRSGSHLLSAMEQAAERPGMRLLDGSFADPETVERVGLVDAVLLLDVLHRMAEPDWDEVLALYAPATQSFVIVNPQWERDGGSVRLTDLGREEFLGAVPPWASHRELFDHLDDPHGVQHRHRSPTDVWQWGITDADLVAKMKELGFTLDRDWRLNSPPETQGFVNEAFVFTREAA